MKLHSFIKESGVEQSEIPHGFANGYVLLPQSHPMFGVDYFNIPVEVHGGLTFSRNTDSLGWEEAKEYPNHWCVGFDTCHSGDSLETWGEAQVVEEINNLKAQLEAML